MWRPPVTPYGTYSLSLAQSALTGTTEEDDLLQSTLYGGLGAGVEVSDGVTVGELTGGSAEHPAIAAPATPAKPTSTDRRLRSPMESRSFPRPLTSRRARQPILPPPTYDRGQVRSSRPRMSAAVSGAGASVVAPITESNRSRLRCCRATTFC